MSQRYARLSSNVVVEIIQIPDDVSIDTQFTPSLVSTMVVGDNATAVGMTWDGSQFHQPVVPTPSPDELLAGKLAAGIAITSGDAALNGTYSIDASSQQKISGLISLIGAGGVLPATPLPYPDMAGVPHNFSAQELTHLASAMAAYVFALQQTWGALKQGFPAPWPEQPVSIP